MTLAVKMASHSNPNKRTILNMPRNEYENAFKGWICRLKLTTSIVSEYLEETEQKFH